MRWFFNLIYLALLTVFSPLLLYRAVRKAKYRHGWGEKLLGRAPSRNPNSARIVWLHAVSMGEVHLLEPLVRELQRSQPDWECVISTTTATGSQAAARKFPDLVRFYCPLDFSWAVNAAMRRVQPDLVVLSELELWPNLIEAAKNSGAQVAIVNGRLSDNSYRGYQRLKWLVARVLRRVDLVCAQNDTYAERFKSLGVPVEKVCVTGSIKFDGAVIDRQNSVTTRLRRLAAIEDHDRIFLAGSTQDPEERFAIETFLSLAAQRPELQLLLAPRHPERFAEVAALLEQMNVSYQRRSDLEAHGRDRESRVLLLDAMGELRAWWGVSHVAYVGGSMGKREGQNMIEPAAYGTAVSFGPRTANFHDIVQLLLDGKGATVVHDLAELTQFVRGCLECPGDARRQGERAQAVVLGQLGAATATAELLTGLIGEGRLHASRAA